ncbi:MAG: DUF1080 domain-containing protein [Armatimonadota bacterium]|nr:DUF1080 domain-containing protein [Armatimonadota bacterium]
MKVNRQVAIVATMMFLTLTASHGFMSLAAEPEEKEHVALEPEQAGPDFKIQGEYAGEFTSADGKSQKLGVQVVALGKGTFRAIFLAGGLPGYGWDEKSKVEINGHTADDKTTFGGTDGYSATIDAAGEVLTGQTDKGEKFELKKVQRQSPTLGATAPEGALVLFDGTNTDAWQNGRIDERKLLMVGAITKKSFRDFALHVEFRLPFKPSARGQGRGNSGVYLQERYEVQILDSFGFKLDDKKPVGDICGEIYKQKVGTVNMCFPPLAWQTYDIDFQAAKFDEAGKKTQNAIITVKHNGVVIHDKYEITGKTGAGKPEGPEARAILLQNHANPVFFRNIWIVEK